MLTSGLTVTSYKHLISGFKEEYLNLGAAKFYRSKDLIVSREKLPLPQVDDQRQTGELTAAGVGELKKLWQQIHRNVVHTEKTRIFQSFRHS
jgi:hypothetical protein